ncbi:MAG: glucuronate isomerase [Spirochaetaceae bacterium]|nr:glucuronate isomerase [Spirochaetaceae bacterium]
MKSFMDDDFLLESGTALTLYHSVAAREPIFDYHCHLNPAQIAENKRFATITEMWLGGDHYKWRAMRAMGFDESLITGDADDYDKFCAWAQTVEELIGNPLYHWTHLELRRYFGIDEPLTHKSAPDIWKKTNASLSDISVKDIFKKFNVYAVGTTDDPIDTLEHHTAIAEGRAAIGTIDTKVQPTFRPDRALAIDKPGFGEYIQKLSTASGVPVNSVDSLIAALENRLAFFVRNGCRASDHGLDAPPFLLLPNEKIEAAFRAALAGEPAGQAETEAFKTKVLSALAVLYARHGLAMQMHFGALRNVSARSFSKLGADTGFDAAADFFCGEKLAALLSHFEGKGGIPKTILYSLNPTAYYPLVTVMGGFQDSAAEAGKRGVKGRMQLGSAWWFCDHKSGMEAQMSTLADTGLLSAFIGMLTDSRSFLSYPRHEYFRRILCNLIGRWVENGEYPADMETLQSIVSNICFQNARRYFAVI